MGKVGVLTFQILPSRYKVTGSVIGKGHLSVHIEAGPRIKSESLPSAQSNPQKSTKSIISLSLALDCGQLPYISIKKMEIHIMKCWDSILFCVMFSLSSCWHRGLQRVSRNKAEFQFGASTVDNAGWCMHIATDLIMGRERKKNANLMKLWYGSIMDLQNKLIQNDRRAKNMKSFFFSSLLRSPGCKSWA